MVSYHHREALVGDVGLTSSLVLILPDSVMVTQQTLTLLSVGSSPTLASILKHNTRVSMLC